MIIVSPNKIKNMKLEKWEDSVEILYDMIQQADTESKKKMCLTMLKIIARTADNYEEEIRRQNDEVKEKLEEIYSELWHGNCGDKE